MLRPTLALLGLALSFSPAAFGGEHGSTGIPAGDGLQLALDAARHRAVAVDGGFAVRSRAQRWRAEFDGRGFGVAPDGAAWTFGLELAAWGRSGTERAVAGRASASAGGARVEYDRGAGLVEWFVSRRSGLEHGFTLQERPAGGAAPLSFLLAVRGGLAPSVEPGARDARFALADGEVAITYTGLHAFDAEGRALEARLEAAPEGLRVVVDDRGARYPVTVDPVVQQAYVKASNTDEDDSFGWSVAASGDTVVVGTRFEDSSATGVNGDQADNGATESGAAYVFVREGGVWSQQAYLKASNAEAGDAFGQRVSLSGDTLVVGAPGESSSSSGVNGDESNNDAPGSGAAYVFVRNGATWTQEAYLKASNADEDDGFGHVAISGDTIVVAAVGEDSSSTGVGGDESDDSLESAGAAYVFVRNGTTWSQEAYLKASNTDEFDFFGGQVDISGDTIAVGTVWERSAATGVDGDDTDNSAVEAGAVYVFARDASGWSQQAYVKASNTEENDWFGVSLSLSGDTLVVGAMEEDSGATGVNGAQGNGESNSGAAYVFVRNGSTWSQEAYLKASNTDSLDRFGQSVAVSGDVLVVGASREESSATGIDGNQADNSMGQGAGASYLFERDGSGWTQRSYLKASNTGSTDRFGWTIALSGDVLVVGAINEDSASSGIDGTMGNMAPDSGAVYVFDLGLEPGIERFGTGTPGCDGPQTLGVVHAPMMGTPHFAITCDNAPPSSFGLCFIADTPDFAGSDPLGQGILLHFSLFSPNLFVFLMASDSTGYAQSLNTGLPYDPGLIGFTFYAQAAWAWSSCSLPPDGLSSSAGLSVTILTP